ncbi:MAG: sulfate respiration complex protein HmcD [Pseudomonadota bacterium]
MHTIFHTLHDFLLHSKSITYILVGGILIGLMLFWFFLTGRDEKKRTF